MGTGVRGHLVVAAGMLAMLAFSATPAAGFAGIHEIRGVDRTPALKAATRTAHSCHARHGRPRGGAICPARRARRARSKLRPAAVPAQTPLATADSIKATTPSAFKQKPTGGVAAVKKIVSEIALVAPPEPAPGPPAPAPEEPAPEPPVLEEPAVEEPAPEEPAVEEPAPEPPPVEEPAPEEPTPEEPAPEPAPEPEPEPAPEEPAPEEPAPEPEPTPEEPAPEEPAPEEPAPESPPPIFASELESPEFDGWHLQALPGRVTISNVSPFSGGGNARFEVREGDIEPETGSNRAELSGPTFSEGQDIFVRDAIRVPTSSTFSGSWQIIQQLHETEWGGSPGVALFLDSSRGLKLIAGDGSPTFWQGPQLQADRWYDLVYRVKLSQDAAVGFVEVWLNGVKQTVSSGTTRVYGRTIQTQHTYLKVGIYRTSSSSGTSVVEHDNIVVGTSLASVLGA
jgi:hypothetical protein